MNWPLSILIANIVSTLFLVGLIWMVQVVHYPLFDDVGEQHYVDYQQRHQTNITLIVGPMMLIELLTSIWLAWYPISEIGRPLALIGVGLVLLIWLSTAFIQVPCHERLSNGFDLMAYQRLVQTNWIRTIAWSVRGIVVVLMLTRMLGR